MKHALKRVNIEKFNQWNKNSLGFEMRSRRKVNLN